MFLGLVMDGQKEYLFQDSPMPKAVKSAHTRGSREMRCIYSILYPKNWVSIHQNYHQMHAHSLSPLTHYHLRPNHDIIMCLVDTHKVRVPCCLPSNIHIRAQGTRTGQKKAIKTQPSKVPSPSFPSSQHLSSHHPPTIIQIPRRPKTNPALSNTPPKPSTPCSSTPG